MNQIERNLDNKHKNLILSECAIQQTKVMSITRLYVIMCDKLSGINSLYPENSKPITINIYPRSEHSNTFYMVMES